jgi:lysophospholipase L1-like esterase
MHRTHFLRAAFAALLVLVASGPLAMPPKAFGQRSAATDSAVAKFSSARWERAIRAFEAEDKKSPPPQGAVLFIGSSTIRFWDTLAKDFPEYKVINRGFGGSQLSDSVYFADRIVIPYKPRLIVLYAGSNDINAGKSPQTVLADFRAFVARVRGPLPDTRIAFLSISPAPSRWSQADKQREANRLIRDYVATDTKHLDYIDCWKQFLGPDGKPREDLFRRDRLHNNAAGYKIRAEAVRPHLAAKNE